MTVGLIDNVPLAPLWELWVGKTVTDYDFSWKEPVPDNLLGAYFEKWMVFNEPFMRGLFPWNAMDLFSLAKAKTIELQGPGPRSPIYVGGLTGANPKSSPVGQYERRKNPMSPLERHWALMCYGGGRVGDEYRTDAIAAHLQGVLGPETRFHSGDGEFRRDDYSGTLDASASLFSLGRFWGLDPVRVMLDETTIKAPNAANPAEAQANFLERTLLLTLTSGYVDGFLMAWEDKCEKPGVASDTPGFARHREPQLRKPGFYGAMLIHTMLGVDDNPTALFYESSFPLEATEESDGPLYCLRFRGVGEDSDLVTIAVWSAAERFNDEYDREADGVEVTLSVASNEPLDTFAARARGASHGAEIEVCNSGEWIPEFAGGIPAASTLTPDNNEISFKVTGSPIYLQSSTNEVVGSEDWAEASTLSGLTSTSRYDGAQSFQIDFHAEHHYAAGDKIEFTIPSDWWPPSLNPASKGYVTIHPVSHSLQDGNKPSLSLEGDDKIIVTPAGPIPAGSQFSLVYGDSRSTSTLLDMGSWSSGPVDLDFLKFENWMTYEAEFDYIKNNPLPMVPYRAVPRAGWGFGPNDDALLGEDQMRTQYFGTFNHSKTGIYRDFTAMVFYDDLSGDPVTEIPLHLKVTPNTEYVLQVYLNNPETGFEECDPQVDATCLNTGECGSSGNPTCDKCFPIDPFGDFCLKPSIGQTVRVKYGADDDDYTPALDSSMDRYFHFTPTSNEIELIFEHDGDQEGLRYPPLNLEPWLDNLIFCYGIELREAGLGGGPAGNVNPGYVTIPVRVYREEEEGQGREWIDLPNPPTIYVSAVSEQHYVQPSNQ